MQNISKNTEGVSGTLHVIGVKFPVSNWTSPAVNHQIGDIVGVCDSAVSSMQKLSGAMNMLAESCRIFNKCIKPIYRESKKRKPFANSKHKPRLVRMRGK